MKKPCFPTEDSFPRRYSQKSFTGFVWLYRFRFFRPLIRRFIDQVEGGSMHSRTLRRILKEQYEVEVGMYSYGPCLRPGILPPGTIVGRYCSFGPEIVVFRRNHPPDRLSLHPFFFNRRVGIVAHDTLGDVRDNPLRIGHDVWIGARTIILPGCRHIGNGAVIGAGSVVTRDVPEFSIVAGSPARFIRDRFPDELKVLVGRSQWWTKPIEILATHLAKFAVPLEKVDRNDLLSLDTNRTMPTPLL